MPEVEDPSYVTHMENLVVRAASRMKSPTSVESDHWKPFCEEGERLLRNEMEGVSGAREASISRLTCDRGWEGWRRRTVGTDLGFVLVSEWVCEVEMLEGFLESPSKGSINLNRCEEVGRSLPVER